MKRSGGYVVPAADESERELTATLCSDILRLRGMLESEDKRLHKTRLWLTDQQRAYCDNPLAMRLILTECLLISMGLVLNQFVYGSDSSTSSSLAAKPEDGEVIYTDPINGTTLRPLAMLYQCVSELQTSRGTVSELSSQLHDNPYKELEKTSKEQSDRLRSAITTQRRLEKELQEERKEGLKRSQELMVLKLEKKQEKIQLLNYESESPSGSPQHKGRLHRLFSSSKVLPSRSAHVTESKSFDSSLKTELTLMLRDIEPPSNKPLTPEEISSVTDDVYSGLSKYIDDAHDILTSSIPAVENQVITMKDNAQLMGHKFDVGVTLVDETRRKVELLTERCKSLELHVEDKEKRIHTLESALATGNASSAAILSLQQELDEAYASKSLLEKTISAISTGRDDISSFLNSELQSMRGAFSIKIDLASQKLGSANSEIRALRERVCELEDVIGCT